MFSEDFLGAASEGISEAWICPFLPSPDTRIKRVHSLLPITEMDHVLDIGCGDGRVMIELAKKSGCVCSGIEVDGGLIDKAQVASDERGVSSQCKFVVGDALAQFDGSYSLLEFEKHDWGTGSRGFTVVVLFLIDAALRKVRPLVQHLWEKGGVTVVTLGAYHFEDWVYDRADLDLDVWVIDPKKVDTCDSFPVDFTSLS